MKKPQPRKSAPPKTPTRSAKTSARPKYTPEEIRRNRIIAVGALLAIAIIVVALVMAVRAGIAAVGRWQQAQAAEAKAYQLRMEQRTFDPPKPCEKEALQTSLTHASPVVYVGAGDQLELTMQNTGKVACTVTVDPAKIGVQVVSGNQIIYNSTACQGDKTPQKQLLLDVNMSWKYPLSWDGKVQNADCSPSNQAAKAGTYRFQAIWNGTLMPEETVFVVQDAPAPSAPATSETATPTPSS
ncbi:hypothetical protein [Mobiluncus porci]|uniref:hypothetical protein n=1 Tax=Mobiluncus porci TaxID=2652278 RepID=UPI0030B8DC67